MSKALLIVTALAEAATGVALIIAPSLVVELLLGEGLNSPPALVLARIAGAALIAIGVTCWLASKGGSLGYRALAGGMLIYNVALSVLLIHAALALGMHGTLLWPAVVYHTVMALWCALSLRPRSASQ